MPLGRAPQALAWILCVGPLCFTESMRNVLGPFHALGMSALGTRATMEKLMKALVYHGPGNKAVEDRLKLELQAPGDPMSWPPPR